jgi:2-oxoisovalerate dehydrogenase E2 component (dihydrolipoyl transacylase)
MTSFALPDLGEGLQEAEIVDWHVAAGDHVVADQPLVSVETEKAVVEIPSPHSGRILHLLAKVGDHIKVGAPLVEFEEGAHADAGTVVGDLEPRPEHHAVAPARPTTPARSTAIRAAPAVRALAAGRGVDLALVAGTGPEGTITREDVMRVAAATPEEAAREALRGVRLSMARNTALSHQSVVPATIFDEADVDAWYRPTADVTIRLVRAIAAGCAAEPALNCWFDAERMERTVKRRVDLGIAVDTEAGLIVPVLRDAGRNDVTSMRRSFDALVAATRARTVAPADLKGATITLSNFGVIGGRYACLVVVPPQVAIIGAGRIVPRVVPPPPGATFHSFLPLSLTFDHRAVTGGEAARFIRAMIEDLERQA